MGELWKSSNDNFLALQFSDFGGKQICRKMKLGH